MFGRFFIRKQAALLSVSIVFLASGCLWAQSDTEVSVHDSTKTQNQVNAFQIKSHQTNQKGSSFHLPQSTTGTNGKIQAAGSYNARKAQHSDSNSSHSSDAKSALQLLLIVFGLFALRRSRKLWPG